MTKLKDQQTGDSRAAKVPESSGWKSTEDDHSGCESCGRRSVRKVIFDSDRGTGECCVYCADRYRRDKTFFTERGVRIGTFDDLVRTLPDVEQMTFKLKGDLLEPFYVVGWAARQQK